MCSQKQTISINKSRKLTSSGPGLPEKIWNNIHHNIFILFCLAVEYMMLYIKVFEASEKDIPRS